MMHRKWQWPLHVETKPVGKEQFDDHISKSRYSDKDYPINPKLCRQCKWRQVYGYYYHCNYYELHHGVPRDTSADTWEDCKSFEKRC